MFHPPPAHAIPWSAKQTGPALRRWACCGAMLAVTLGNSASSTGGELVPPTPAFRAPYRPAADADVLQEVPSTKDPAVAAMRTLRVGLDAAPQSLAAAKQLADAYVDYSRQVGDAHYAGYAEAVIAPWVNSPAPPASALVTQATILQYRHQFGEAKDLLQKALKSDPRNLQAWLTLANLDMVQGEYPAAAKNCVQVTNLSVEVGLVCSANLRSYIGQARQSLVILQQVESSSVNAPANFRAWVQGLMAETAERIGDWPLAEAHYRNALQLQPEDNFLLVAYADFLLDRNRPQEVLPLLADHTQSDTAFLRIALAESALHSDQVQRYTWVMAARFEALRARGSEYFGREESRFALQLQHDPEAALDMGLRNWQVQRAPWDARVVLEAALAAKKPRAAVDVLEFVARTKLEDPVIEPVARQLRAQLTGQQP